MAFEMQNQTQQFCCFKTFATFHRDGEVLKARSDSKKTLSQTLGFTI